MKNSDGVPTYIPREVVVPRTRSEEMTRPMYMLDHTLARQDGAPDLPAWDDDDTEVDVVVVDVRWR